MLVVDTYLHTNGSFLRIYNAYAWSDIETGCILEYTYHGFKHHSVVTKIYKEADRIQVIHYGFAHIFGTQSVVREVIQLDFKTDNIPAFTHNEPDVVVEKAKGRLGEQRWSIATNSGLTFCMCCLFN
ncbi:hypothetical protein DPMN_001876 [Dreissena polymorpha]|uniref:Uncharacterized protein n=1 Tax=Dreissena polymorpha TaxID=45954 RepID=A0A9D4RQQ2_DREPO|nr:hypothetical protein DPMN_001875 [Dreissena polymorpha]KAH3877996.1 hypothetical protein DPMN_001876 [Dreissena polymorpha]